MKVHLSYRWSHDGLDIYGHPPRLIEWVETFEQNRPEWYGSDVNLPPQGWGEIALLRPISTYLFSALSSDFCLNRYGHIDHVLSEVETLVPGEKAALEWEGQGFTHHITRDRVRFEHSVFSECPEWPIWCCTLAQYKAALQGYRQFLSMPESIETELVIELPEGDARCD